MFLQRSLPRARDKETKHAKPRLASQAPKVRMTRARISSEGLSSITKAVSIRVKVKIMASKASRPINRCCRWIDRVRRAMKTATGVIYIKVWNIVLGELTQFLVYKTSASVLASKAQKAELTDLWLPKSEFSLNYYLIFTMKHESLTWKVNVMIYTINICLRTRLSY